MLQRPASIQPAPSALRAFASFSKPACTDLRASISQSVRFARRLTVALGGFPWLPMAVAGGLTMSAITRSTVAPSPLRDAAASIHGQNHLLTLHTMHSVPRPPCGTLPVAPQ
ncbi:hypothetical protein IQ07DRAFT_585108 [Pyrenochaeta sp. DS3sAY3a]|nr:hypothetical protein IQ07DRAFT_585108 [Pyrenochaeta sp. DS3sAY3a]